MTYFLIFALIGATLCVPYFGNRPSSDGAAFVGFVGSIVAVIWSVVLLVLRS